jgi:ABC-type transport system involved in multi-copper enzyme maturation permease subunit
MRGITRDTLVELVDRKAGFVIPAAGLAGLVAVLANDWHGLQISFGDGSSSALSGPTGIAEIALQFLSTYMSVLMVLVVLLVMGLFPAIVNRERAWFYFTMPMSRGKFLTEKLLAVLIVYGGLLLTAALPTALAGIVRYGLYDLRVGEIVSLYLFTGMIWMIIAAAFGLLFRSTLHALLACVGVWVAQLVLVNREVLAQSLGIPLIGSLLRAMRFLAPGTVELGRAAHQLASGRPIDVTLPIVTSLLFAVVLLYSGLSAVNRRDL